MSQVQGFQACCKSNASGLKKQGHGRDTALLMVYRNRRGLPHGEDGPNSPAEDGVELVDQVLNLRPNFVPCQAV